MKKLIPYAAAIVIAAGAFFTGSVTDVGQAVKLALDKEAAAIACAELLNGETETTE